MKQFHGKLGLFCRKLFCLVFILCFSYPVFARLLRLDRPLHPEQKYPCRVVVDNREVRFQHKPQVSSYVRSVEVSFRELLDVIGGKVLFVSRKLPQDFVPQYGQGWAIVFQFKDGAKTGRAEWRPGARLLVNGRWYTGYVGGGFTPDKQRKTIEVRPLIEALYGKTYTTNGKTFPRVHYDKQSRTIFIWLEDRIEKRDRHSLK